MALLSKSRYLNGMQCAKYLWTAVNDKKKIPEVDAALQHRFDQGHMVGELAKKLHPGGIDIACSDFSENIRKTATLLGKKKPLFEAGFMAGQVYARTDILAPAEGGAWDIIEVKSSTEAKDEHTQDLAFQKHVCTLCGLKIRKCMLRHIDNGYVKHGEIDPEGIFATEDVTADVDEALKAVPAKAAEMLKVLKLEDCPDIEIGKQCTDPYDCPLIEECWKKIPKHSVFDLYNARGKQWELFSRGVLALKDIPADFKLNEKQEIQRNTAKTCKPHIEKEALKRFLAKLKFPLHFLDFETFNPAVPLFDGMRPYQRVPFQFSLHILTQDGGMVHVSFLAEDAKDPRKQFTGLLRNALGDTGSIVVYNAVFERGVLKELADAFTEHKKWTEQAISRIIDLIEPFKDFHYYHPAQQGSCSIKEVLPAMTGRSYDSLEISGGEQASIAFLDAMYGGASDAEKENIRARLEEYCCLDTEGMVMIYEELKKLTGR